MVWLIVILLSALCVFNLLKVAIYGRSFIRPDFERVDRIFRDKTGFPAQGRSAWNNRFGKLIYYSFWIGFILITIFIIKTLAG